MRSRFLPPLSPRPQPEKDDLADLLAVHLATLYCPGLGVRLLARYGGAGRVLAAGAASLCKVEGVTPAIARRLAAADAAAAGAAELRAATELGVEIVPYGSRDFPERLAGIESPPLVLFVRAAAKRVLARDAGHSVAIVGSRRPSLYGRRQARRFARWLAQRGILIVSGLARGADSEAHRGALEARGRTWGVVGTGLGRVYPQENAVLASEIVASAGGALISEYSADAAPRSFHFPMRNRLISGLADAVLVIEAGKKSGSLITVRHALDQGKPVFVLPGRVDQPQSRGCLELLRDGAAPALDPSDLLLGLVGSEALLEHDDRGSPPSLPGRFGAQLEELFLEEDAWRVEEIAARIGAPLSEVIPELSRLESEGTLQRLPGGRFARR